jgi:hypothetical protein
MSVNPLSVAIFIIYHPFQIYFFGFFAILSMFFSYSVFKNISCNISFFVITFNVLNCFFCTNIQRKEIQSKFFSTIFYVIQHTFISATLCYTEPLAVICQRSYSIPKHFFRFNNIKSSFNVC